MKLTRPRLDAELARRLEIRGRLQWRRARRARSHRVIARLLGLLQAAELRHALHVRRVELVRLVLAGTDPPPPPTPTPTLH